MNKNNIYDLSKSLSIALISGLTVVILQQFFYKSNIDYDFRKNLIKENYEYYVALQNFSDIGFSTVIEFKQLKKKVIILIDKKSATIIGTDSTFEYDSTKQSIEIPTIAFDTLKQNRWLKDKDFIINNRNKIEHNVYLSFLDIVRIVEKNPWPKFTDYKSLKGSIWTRENFIENWKKKNINLWIEVNKYIKL